jgi:hypothetical protein
MVPRKRPWGPEGRRDRAAHAGHADIIRELIDGRIGANESVHVDPTFWTDRRGMVQAVADVFR